MMSDTYDTAGPVPWLDAPKPPRAWQREALPLALAGLDSTPGPLVEAVMGAGKSILIAELANQAASRGIRVVVSTPTQDLVRQLAATISARNPGRVGTFYADSKQTGYPIMVTCYPSVQAFAAADPGAVGECLWICDEAHKSESPREKVAFDCLRPRYRLALSATPYRADDTRLSLWSEVVYRYPIGAALRDGVLVPWHSVHPRPEETAGNMDADATCDAMLRRVNPEGPGIIGATSIEDAEAYAAHLCATWGPVAPIHSRQPLAKRQALIEELRTGRLRALVHVALLAEGVDLPWLSWLMLRRKIGSRVLKLQQLGRVLRSHPGKTAALVLDPWGCLDDFSIEYAAALGENEPDKADNGPSEAEITADEEGWDELMDLPEAKVKRIPRATASRAAGAWIRRVLHACTAAGLREPSQWERDASWREKRASDKSLAYLGKILWGTRHLPPEIREPFRWLAKDAGALRLSGGAVSDMIDVLRCSLDAGQSARDARRAWSWTSPLPIPALPGRVREALRPETTQQPELGV